LKEERVIEAPSETHHHPILLSFKTDRNFQIIADMARRPSSEALLMQNTMESPKKKRVLIVGAGAAG